MSEPIPDEQPGAADPTRRTLDGLEVVWASPPMPADWAPAGPRRNVARLLGHLDLSATGSYIKPEGDQE
ncbi:hypothetical protein [Kitasatospora cineracea]|uniref:hypothetical protein n=1 Tax=Kitasatospora cineracea TaxID=88074 RepID=UPI0033CCB869